ncbi:hypothetical protein U14_03861 [Candidatus Moduliflexus flocculans]|uniref:Uncharacterized protein n=1 Tax=Candidatus Moduliflexus flocculans TaxID=1499966 RepID=A0A081BQE3_9BACT|nr:hypothetical protein U14_03861 [Candidatus Moduliflexus flocculans]
MNFAANSNPSWPVSATNALNPIPRVTSIVLCARSALSSIIRITLSPATIRPRSSSTSVATEKTCGFFTAAIGFGAVCGATGIGSAICFNIAGSVKVNVVPLPTSLSSAIAPCSSLAYSRAIESPSPVPPNSREIEPSACWNASKTSCCLSFGIPTPVSSTEISTVSALPGICAARSVTDPCLVNLNALASRLRRICESLSRSVFKTALNSSEMMNSSPFSSAIERNRSLKVWKSSATENSVMFMVTLPDSILLRSRMSLIRRSSSSPA